MIAKRSDMLKTSLKMTQVTCLKKQRCSLPVHPSNYSFCVNLGGPVILYNKVTTRDESVF